MHAITQSRIGEPMMDINTTPLIDVMLVLLIMFIITIPIQTHAVKLDLPQSHRTHAAADRPGQEQDRDHAAGPGAVERRAGRSARRLRQYLDLTRR